MVRPQDEELKELLAKFVCVRVTRMNEVDIRLFQFDYDLTWMCFFLDGNDRIYSRYGGRDAGDAEGRITVASLKHTMREVLADYRPPASSLPPREPWPANQVFTRARGCMHCHNVWEGLREQARADGTLTRESLFVYPLPENIGLKLDVTVGNKVVAVTSGSPSGKVGVLAGDVVTKIGSTEVRSQCDVMQALHEAPMDGKFEVHWRRGRQDQSATLEVNHGWKETDLSWRTSIKRMPKLER